MNRRLNGLVAATHTPFDADGELEPRVVEAQAEHLIRNGVSVAFIGGTTGECHSLSLSERLALTDRWSAVARDSSLRVVVHVGSNCLSDSRVLAEHAQRSGALAVAAFAPSYFRPPTLEILVECCRLIAMAAPDLPFYFYDIPSMTHVQFSMPEFLERASERIPNLAGIKFTNSDLMAFQRCLHVAEGRFDVLWGSDEYLLAALVLGGHGAVGSSYNMAAPIYRRLIQAFQAGDLSGARLEQYRSVQLIQVLGEFGYMAAAKALMGMLGVPVGQPRLPIPSLSAEQHSLLKERLLRLGFFDWVSEGSRALREGSGRGNNC